MLRPGVDASLSRPLTCTAPAGESTPLGETVRRGGPVADDGSVARGEPGCHDEAVARGGPVARGKPGSHDDPVPRDEPRLLAARLLERTLLRLGRASTVVERRLAPALARMHGRRLYRLLGYVRLADFLTERLGMSLRRCQAILRLERALASLPRLAQAFEAGEVSVSKLEVVAGAVTPETEQAWLQRARRLPLAALRELARESSAGGDGIETSAPDGRADTTPGTPASRADAAPSAMPTAPIEQDEPGRFISFSAPAPVLAIWHWTLDLVRRVAGQQEPAWRCAEYLAAEFLSGVPDTGGAPPVADASPGDGCAPRDAGRSRGPRQPAPLPDPFAPLPGRPVDLADPSATLVDRSAPPPHRPADDAPGMSAWTEACDAVREALASIGASADPEAILLERPTPDSRPTPDARPAARSRPVPDSHPAPDSRVESPDRPAAGARASFSDRPASSECGDSTAASGDAELDAWELDARLRRLVRMRQSLAWRQGHLLAAFASLRLHRDLGFNTFDDWVGDRLAMSPRRARYLVSLARRLRALPLLADAYRRGLVSWCQARLLVRIVRPATQTRWIRYARQVTVRRLEDVLVECEVGAATSSTSPAPGAPAHIGAPPLPPSEPLPHSWPTAASAQRTAFASESPSAQRPTSPSEPAFASQPAESIVPPCDAAPGDVAPGDAPHRDAAPRHTSAPTDPATALLSAPAGTSHPHTSAPRLDVPTISLASSDRRSWRRVSFWCPLDVASLWDSALRACRAAAGHHREDWECFLLLARSLRDTWENQEDPHWRRRYRTLERDGWRCKAPGCTSRSGLNEHHIVFRSQQGGDDAENLVTLCVGHHQQGLHEGRIRCFGRAPVGLWWDMGVKPGGEPLARYFGDRLVEGRPFAPGAASPRAAAASAVAPAQPTRVASTPARVAAPAPRLALPPRIAPPPHAAPPPPRLAPPSPRLASATMGGG